MKFFGKRPRRAPVGAYLAVTFALCLAALGTLLATTTASSFDRERSRTSSELRAAARYHADLSDQSMPEALDVFDGVATQPGITSMDPEGCQAVLGGLSSVQEQAHVHLFRPDGSLVCSLQAPELPVREVPRGSWFEQVVSSNAPVVGETFLDPLSGQPAVALAAPVEAPDHRVGVLAAILYTGVPPLDLPAGASSAMVVVELDPARRMVLATSPQAPVSLGPLDTSWMSAPLGRGTHSRVDPDGVTRLYVEVTAPQLGWHLLAGLPVDVALASARSELHRNLWLAGAVLVIVAGLGLLLHRHLARPVRRLRDAIEAAGTDPTVRAPVEGPAEVAAVAEAFNITIAERRSLEEQLAHQALHDPLTGLPNRALLDDRLRLALARQQRAGGLLAVAFMDLDRFKIINDSYGHPAGDRLLVALARRLSAAMRPSDTVARFGGDEFVMISEDLASSADVDAIARRLTDCLERPFTIDDDEIHLSGSVGVAIASGEETPDELIRDADTAMYSAKELERGGYVVYDQPLHAGALSRLETERDLRRAISHREFVLHYQPKRSLATGEVVGVEALVRWAHPTRGMVSPADFIPVSEETGLILPIGEWILEEACRQASRWRNERGVPVTVAVNLSARQLGRTEFTRLVRSALESSGVEPADLCLEITEGTLLVDTAATVRQLAELRSLGVRISVDDFGTGYSSLAYLRTLPLDEIKIDRSFVTPVAEDATAAAIVGSIVSLGHALGLLVVAEGVETEAQLRVLGQLGCDLAQGFHLGRPQPADQLSLGITPAGARLGRG